MSAIINPKDPYECIEPYAVQFEQFQRNSAQLPLKGMEKALQNHSEEDKKNKLENELIDEIEKICEGRIAYNQALLEYFQNSTIEETQSYYREIYNRDVHKKFLSKEHLLEYISKTIDLYSKISQKIKDAILSSDEYALDRVYDNHKSHIYVEFTKHAKYDSEFSYFDIIFRILKPYLSATYKDFNSKILNTTQKFSYTNVYNAFHKIYDLLDKEMKKFYSIAKQFNLNCQFLDENVANNFKMEIEAFDPIIKTCSEFYNTEISPLFEEFCELLKRRKMEPNTEEPDFNKIILILKKGFANFDSLQNKLDICSENLNTAIFTGQNIFALKKLEIVETEIKNEMELKKLSDLKATKLNESERAAAIKENEKIAAFKLQKELERKTYKETLEKQRAWRAKEKLQTRTKNASDKKCDFETRAITDIEKEQIQVLYQRLNPTQLEVLDIFLNEDIEKSAFKVTLPKFENLVCALGGTLDNSTGSSHFKITLPNTYAIWKIDESLIAYVDLPVASGGSWKPHGEAHNNEELWGFAFKLCSQALKRAGITRERIEHAVSTQTKIYSLI